MSNEYDWWTRAISGEILAVHADAPQSGFYKMRLGKDGPWQPVMIRMHDGALRCRVGSNSDADPYEVWTFCAVNPVTKEAAAYAFKHGKWETDAPTIGDNSGNATPLELLRDYIETARSWFKGKKLDSQKALDEAANYAAQLTKLKNEADRERDSLIRPHLDAQRDINANYKPQIEDADALVKQIKRGCDDFMRAEKSRLEAEQRAKYEAERKAAEEARKDAEEQRAKQMADDPIAAMTSPAPELPMPPPLPEPIKVQAGGQRGKKMALRTYTDYVVKDYAKTLAFFADHEKVREVVQSLATQVSKTGVKVPGVEVVTEERAT